MNKSLRKAVIAGNWKMNKTPEEAKELLEAIKPLVQDADDEHFRLHAKIEDAVMLAKQVSILCVYWNQRIQGLAASGKMFQR